MSRCAFAAFDVNAFGMTRDSVRNLNFNDVYFGSRLAHAVSMHLDGLDASADAISKAINQDRARRPPLPELLPVPVYIGADLGSMVRERDTQERRKRSHRRHFLLAPARGTRAPADKRGYRIGGKAINKSPLLLPRFPDTWRRRFRAFSIFPSRDRVNQHSPELLIRSATDGFRR